MRQCLRIHAFHCCDEKSDAKETQKTVSQLRVQCPVAGLRRTEQFVGDKPRLEHSKAENVFLISEILFRSGFMERFPAV